MSDSSQILVDVDARADEAPRLAMEVLDWLAREGVVEREATASALGGDGHRPGTNYRGATDGGPEFRGLATNGVEVIAERRVFDAGGNGIELRCGACGHAFEPDARWFEAAGAWASGDDEVRFPCPACGVSALLGDWRGDGQWGFGNLALQFWNWPPLSESFIGAVAKRLGHRIVVVRNRV